MDYSFPFAVFLKNVKTLLIGAVHNERTFINRLY